MDGVTIAFVVAGVCVFAALVVWVRQAEPIEAVTKLPSLETDEAAPIENMRIGGVESPVPVDESVAEVVAKESVGPLSVASDLGIGDEGEGGGDSGIIDGSEFGD